jgi:hypothetical protein
MHTNIHSLTPTPTCTQTQTYTHSHSHTHAHAHAHAHTHSRARVQHTHTNTQTQTRARARNTHTPHTHHTHTHTHTHLPTHRNQCDVIKRAAFPPRAYKDMAWPPSLTGDARRYAVLTCQRLSALSPNNSDSESGVSAPTATRWIMIARER